MYKTLLCLKRCIKHKDVLKICTTKYFGKNLSSEQRLKAEDLLSTMYVKLIPTYLSVLAQTDPFSKLRFRKEAR